MTKKISDDIRNDSNIVNPAMKEALAQAADTLGDSAAQRLKEAIARDENSIREKTTPYAVANDITLELQIHPDQVKPLISKIISDPVKAKSFLMASIKLQPQLLHLFQKKNQALLKILENC